MVKKRVGDMVTPNETKSLDPAKLGLGIFVVGILCALIWVVTYNIRSAMLDNEIADMKYVNSVDSDTTVNVTDVVVKIKDVEYNLNDLLTLDEIPTVVDVVVSYVDETSVEKQAYVTYVDSEDISEVSYDDNSYGHIIIPKEVE